MHVAYLILAHKNPAQLARLIQRLHAPHVTFVVHIDRRAPLAAFQDELRRIPNADIEFAERVVSKWGRFGIVQAALNCLRAALSRTPPVERFVLLSGQDYPLRGAREIARYWEISPAKIFIEYFPMPTTHWRGGGLNRIEHYHFDIPKPHWVGRLIGLFHHRRLPLGLKPFGGAQWWSLSRSHAEYVVAFVRDHPEYVRFYRWSLVPDEMFFQTIFLNSSEPAIRENILNDHLRYIVWNAPHVNHPMLLVASDVDAIMASRQLFARKFDAAADATVLDCIDARIDGSER